MSLLLLQLAMLLAITALEPVRTIDPAVVLSYQEEIASTSVGHDSAYKVRVYRVPTVIGECGGPISTCPDVDLLISVSYGDLGKTPSLFRFPPAKGWEGTVKLRWDLAIWLDE